MGLNLRSTRILVGLLCILASGLIANSDQPFDDNLNQYEHLYDDLIHLEPDFHKSAYVQDFTFQRDVARFTLVEGNLYLCKPVMNRVVAAVFIGSGQFHFTPPIEAERKQLYRVYETESLDREFNFLLIIFADSTLLEFQRNLTFINVRAISQVIPKVRKQLKYALKYMGKPKGKEFNAAIMKTFLDVESNGYFYAHFSRKKSRPIFFVINPYEAEEIRLLRRPKNDRSYSTEIVCQFHKKRDYQSGLDLSYESKETMVVSDYNIDAHITKDFEFSASVQIKITALRDHQNWIYFNLFHDLDVDSIFLGDGQEAEFFRGKENPYVWIQCNPALMKDQTYNIKIDYHGELFEVKDDWVFIKAPVFWYPLTNNRNKSMFDLTFHTPADFDFICVGEKVFSETKEKVTTTRWIFKKPIRNASFNIGKFNKYRVNNEGIPSVTVFMAKSYSRFLKGNIMHVTRAEELVGFDIANSIGFFQQMFGRSPMDAFYATEIPGYHGMAFPGLIHLSWATFQSMDTRGYQEIFRAHEVAHQWWGIGVDFRTYHDQWLSEGFAEYSGLWYMQLVLEDNEKFFRILKEWRDQIIYNRKYLFGSGQEAGPIWLGYRTSSTTTRGDYDLIIYKKGAWVLHMLRNMLIDLETMNEDRFLNLIKDFYTTYRDKQASTYDFQKIVEKHFGMDMEWFFKQWIYGTDIPTYEFAYKSEKTKEGKYIVTCKVKQLDVPDDFRMIVPLHIEFSQGQFVKLKIFVQGSLSEITLPLLPSKPKKIIFNDL
ncbi:MAG: hypothetical protein IIA60_03235 [Candidatus Marinimicrobia bacterium]|nr:hypothetical protein [Candidatus Neomarinimicrobiota bacterium]